MIRVRLVLLVASLASYAIGRLKMRYGHVISNTALLTYLIPMALLAIPFYRVMGDYGLLNSRWALIFAMVQQGIVITGVDADWANTTVICGLRPGQRLRIVKYLAYGWSSLRSRPALRWS